MSNLFLIADWITTSFPIVRLVLIILSVLVSLALIFVILIQPGNNGDINALSGGSSDSYFNANKKETIEGKLKRMTVFFSVLLCILILIFMVTLVIYPAT